MNVVSSRLSSLVERANLPILIAMLVIASWLRRCFGSLWLDEALAYWTVSDSFIGTIERTYSYQGQSPLYYSILWIFTTVFGRSELVMRVPSFLASCVSLYFLHAIGTKVFNKKIALHATLIFVFLDGGLFVSSNARPYGIALAAALISLKYFIDWIHEGRTHQQVLHIVFTAITVYAHYFYGGIALAQLLFLLSFWNFRKVSLSQLITSTVLGGVLIAPLIPHLLLLSERSSQLGVAGTLPFLTLLLTLVRPAVPFLLLTAIFYAQAIFASKGNFRESLDSLLKRGSIWVIGWYALGPVLLFLGARLTGTASLFQDHYLFWTEPAFAFIAAIFISKIQPEIAAKTTVIFFALLALIAEPFRPIVSEDWSAASNYLAEIRRKDEPIVYYSGLVESQKLKWLVEPKRENYLTAPLYYYGIKGEKLLLPYSPFQQGAEEYITTQLYPAFGSRDSILFMGTDVISFGGVPASKIFFPFFERMNFEIKTKKYFKKVWVAQLVRKQHDLKKNAYKKSRQVDKRAK